MATRRKNDFLQELAPIVCESSDQALAVDNTFATGTIVCGANAGAADGNTVKINDGFRIVTYEYDKSANGVAAGNVTWAVGTTAASLATALAALIATNQPAFTVVDNLAGTLTLTHNWHGAGANATITQTGSGAVTAVTGMAGGASRTATVTATTTQVFHTCPRVYTVDDVEFNLPGGFVQDASNFWDIELKNGATSVAKWSTLTSAQGTITTNVPVTLVNSAVAGALTFAAGALMTLVLTKHGSPAALPPGRLTVHGHYVS